MHIGTARTALFNYLYARHHQGQFLLRIEDTDRERSTEAAVQVILDGLKWLQLDYDGPPVFQAARADRHRDAVLGLLQTGRAYRCYLTVAELDVEREKARAEGRAIRSIWRDREPPTDREKPHVIRFKGPLDGETLVDDLVKGPVTFRNRELDDLVLLRSDGMPTYNLAVVVDDHDMGITHVIRGDDHLSNAARQSLIYQALEFPVPAFGHLPLIHGSDGAKLSKRHGAQAVGDFAEMGYLPEAMRNYLARLGWGHGDDELFSDAQAIAWFDVKDVVRAPARLDFAKLGHLNNHYLRRAENDRLVALVLETLASVGKPPSTSGGARLERTVSLMKEGAKTVVELAELCGFALQDRPITLPEKVVALLVEETRDRLQRLCLDLAAAPDWTQPALEGRLKQFADAEGVGLGRIGPALRGVLAGSAPAPDLASTLAALGPNESLARIKDALSPVA